MVVTVYISGISGNKEVKKRQQRVQMILESRGIAYEAIDIAEPGRQAERDRLKHCGATTPVLPPQLFNGDDYCGDYDQFDLANEIDEVEKFLKLAPGSTSTTTTNGNKEVVVDNGINVNNTNETERISPEHELEKENEKTQDSDEQIEETPQNSTDIEKDDKEEQIADEQPAEENDEEDGENEEE